MRKVLDGEFALVSSIRRKIKNLRFLRLLEVYVERISINSHRDESNSALC